jgi:hypothetical protein
MYCGINLSQFRLFYKNSIIDTWQENQINTFFIGLFSTAVVKGTSDSVKTPGTRTREMRIQNYTSANEHTYRNTGILVYVKRALACEGYTGTDYAQPFAYTRRGLI